ncbi:nickel/cobalt transporter [Aurantimonas sp. MSK8Z-1]|uniref:nickel/cobalt transporter n=1 Tax=Mangrovibrevibacter kandeliae TaxID=2968473 RepID=UPI00211748E1|nr:nickel/cobalt transporter [Aurantimonas sp. MSK8Z-1]MCW4116368.1 nickel/cobalt transporter [Aurantimonas sp. MSK8Z-1]
MRLIPRRPTGALALVLMTAMLAGPALARSSLGIGSAEAAPPPPAGGLMGAWFAWLVQHQAAFLTSLNHALVAMRTEPGGLTVLVGISFVYGIFHAAGPGHGKAVISSYVFANRVQLRRGIALAFVSSLVQAATALSIVGVGWFVLRGTSIRMTDASDVVETASFALVAAFGGWLLVRKLARLWRRQRAPALALDFSTPRLAGAAAGAGGAPSGGLAYAGMPRASGGYAAEVCSDDAGDCDCGRSHMPDPRRLGTRLTLGSTVSVVLAMGLRPCTGAIGVLTFSLVNGLLLAGVLSVLAMALGTAITVSAIAATAVVFKGAMLGAGGAGRRRVWIVDALEIGGALVLLLLGLSLLAASTVAGG